MDRRLKGDDGFTLIELMISVAVMASLATAITLSLSRPDQSAGLDWVRFQQLHDRLVAEATISRQVLGLRVDAEGYQRLVLDGDWQVAGAPQDWQKPVTVINGALLRFAPGGQSSPFLIRFAGGQTLCEGDGWGGVLCR